MTIDLLIVLDMPQYSRDHLAEAYTVHYWPDPADHPPPFSTSPLAKKIRAVQTNGSYGLKRAYIEAMPALEIICAVGAGFEGIDVAAARERGIVVTNGAGANAAYRRRAGMGAPAGDRAPGALVRSRRARRPLG